MAFTRRSLVAKWCTTANDSTASKLSSRNGKSKLSHIATCKRLKGDEISCQISIINFWCPGNPFYIAIRSLCHLWKAQRSCKIHNRRSNQPSPLRRFPRLHSIIDQQFIDKLYPLPCAENSSTRNSVGSGFTQTIYSFCHFFPLSRGLKAGESFQTFLPSPHLHSKANSAVCCTELWFRAICLPRKVLARTWTSWELFHVDICVHMKYERIPWLKCRFYFGLITKHFCAARAQFRNELRNFSPRFSS